MKRILGLSTPDARFRHPGAKGSTADDAIDKLVSSPALSASRRLNFIPTSSRSPQLPP
jgi:hypothetical protein